MQYKGFNFFEGIYDRKEGRFATALIEFPKRTFELNVPADILEEAGISVGDRFTWMPITLNSKPLYSDFVRVDA